MTKNRPSFARKLTELREAAGLSQYALAKVSGLSKQALSLLELGQREPNWETVQRLALALETDCRTFIDEGLELPEEPDVSAPRSGPGRPPKRREDYKPKPKKKGR